MGERLHTDAIRCDKSFFTTIFASFLAFSNVPTRDLCHLIQVRRTWDLCVVLRLSYT